MLLILHSWECNCKNTIFICFSQTNRYFFCPLKVWSRIPVRIGYALRRLTAPFVTPLRRRWREDYIGEVRAGRPHPQSLPQFETSDRRVSWFLGRWIQTPCSSSTNQSSTELCPCTILTVACAPLSEGQNVNLLPVTRINSVWLPLGFRTWSNFTVPPFSMQCGNFLPL